MKVFTTPPPVPGPLAALPRRVVAPFGSLAHSRDVAAVFGVQTSTLRKWRQAGKWPEATWSEGNNPYYRVADLVPYYYDKFPSALPDSYFGIGDEADAPLIGDRPGAEGGAEGAADLSRWRENGAAGSENAVTSRDFSNSDFSNSDFSNSDFSNSDFSSAASVADIVLERIGETVKEAVSKLVEPAPEAPSVIETLSMVIDAQWLDIERMRAENDRLREELETERRWRERPWLDRLMPKA